MSEVRNTNTENDASRNNCLGKEYHEKHTLVNENLKGVYVMGNVVVMVATALMGLCAWIRVW